MKRKFLSLLLACALLLGVLPLGASAARPFRDVPENSWYWAAVSYASRNGLMNGKENGNFAPNASLLRAELCQILYNMEGRPAAGGSAFQDVSAGDWFAAPVNWAHGEGIVSGTGEGRFSPGRAVTREDMVRILFNYAQYKGYDTSGRADLSPFADQGRVAEYAYTAVQWAVSEGILSGDGAAISPKGTASRAQAASVLAKFYQKLTGIQPEMMDLSPSALPTSLNEFLQRFSATFTSPVVEGAPGYEDGLYYHREYDASHPLVGDPNIMSNLLNVLPCVDFLDYPGPRPQMNVGDNPLGLKGAPQHSLFDGPSADWVATHIFNVSPQDLPVLVAQGEAAESFLRLEGDDGSYTYYVPSGGIGGTGYWQVEFVKAQSDGTNYRVVFRLRTGYTMSGSQVEWIRSDTYYAELEDKILDGRHYWSLHRHTAAIPEDMR